MPRKPRKKHWSKMIQEQGVSIRLYERPRSPFVWYSIAGRGGRKVRQSLETPDRDLAEARAREIASGVALERITGPDIHKGLTIGQLFAAYRRHRKPTLRAGRQTEAESRISMFLEAWGPQLPAADVDATRVRKYCMARRNMTIVSPGRRVDEEGKRRRGYRAPAPVRDGALDAELRWLNSVFNWARGHRMDGRPLLRDNPLTGVDRPREKNPRRPVASQQRFGETMKHADAVDPKGRLRCILALARHTGRRESALCSLRASDLLLSNDRVRSALAASGMDEGMAEYMPHGAIRWAAESDKQGLLFISPVNRDAREALETYLRQFPRLGDVPLFPAPGRPGKKGARTKLKKREPEKPVSRETVGKWLLRAEERASLPKLVGGRFHPYRRLWATERKNLPLVDVAAAGGWKDTQALRMSYQQADPASVLRVVEGG